MTSPSSRSRVSAKSRSLRSRLGRWLLNGVPVVLLLGTGATVVMGGVLSAQFILEPRSVAWVNRYLPAGLQVPIPDWDAPRTLAEIRSAIETEDRVPGETVSLPNGVILLPVIQQQTNCTSQCDRLVALRLYQPAKADDRATSEPKYQLVNQMKLAGVEEWFVLEPMANLQLVTPGTSTPLPLDTVQKMDPPNGKSGIWLNLTGTREEGDTTIRYGRVLNYDPKQFRLNGLADWTSPAGSMPHWEQVTDSTTPELVVDQTVGLEPQIKIYQLTQATGLPRLQAISLLKPAIDQPDYKTALSLARSGLWSIALEWLQDVKKTQSQWPRAAQAQLDLIQRHAKLTQAQAQQASANVSQQVLAKLIDGQWQSAVEVFRKAQDDRTEILDAVRLDAGRLWRRVATMLDADPGDPYAQAWGALIVEERQDRKMALKWIKEYPKSAARDRVIAQLLPGFLPTEIAKKPGSKPSEKSDPIAVNSPAPMSPAKFPAF